ncbi:expressed unknown protein [Seminavis robusta]|uniref:Uncharacterized protein n=1 Tax=Seminavis robusta TaxID=568900 RepID=A0A9N8DH28_9STRA|nr:expressed unknown protein [Seminavis robusta]|eukprot:Sro83_g044280.1 n/a (618) ;mRNA; r:38893-40746
MEKVNQPTWRNSRTHDQGRGKGQKIMEEAIPDSQARRRQQQTLARICQDCKPKTNLGWSFHQHFSGTKQKTRGTTEDATQFARIRQDCHRRQTWVGVSTSTFQEQKQKEPEAKHEDANSNLPEFARIASQRRQTWVGTATKLEQTKEESPTKEDVPVVSRKSWKVPSQIPKHQQQGDTNLPDIARIANRRSSAAAPQSRSKVPQRTRSRSLTQLDQRDQQDGTTSRRKSWKKRPSQLNVIRQQEDQSTNLPDIARIGARRSSSNPQSFIAARRASWLKGKSQEEEAESKVGQHAAVEKSWNKPSTATDEDEKKDEDKNDREEQVASRGRDASPRESPVEVETAELVAPRRQPKRGVARTRSRSLTSLRKDKSEDGTVTRTYLDYPKRNKWVPRTVRCATKIQTVARRFLVRWRLIKEKNAVKIQTVARGFLQRLRWITRKPWLQKKKVERKKERELARIEREKRIAMNGFKYEMEDQEYEREKQLKALRKEKASLEKQILVEKETKQAIRADINKEKEEAERLAERRRTESAITMLQATAVTGVHTQQAGSKKRAKAYKKEIKSTRREISVTQEMWDRERQHKRRIEKCMRSIVSTLREEDDELADFIAKYSGVDVV